MYELDSARIDPRMIGHHGEDCALVSMYADSYPSVLRVIKIGCSIDIDCKAWLPLFMFLRIPLGPYSNIFHYGLSMDKLWFVKIDVMELHK